jgi:hypothetical protein
MACMLLWLLLQWWAEVACMLLWLLRLAVSSVDDQSHFGCYTSRTSPVWGANDSHAASKCQGWCAP